jgi:hypothetical protein
MKRTSIISLIALLCLGQAAIAQYAPVVNLQVESATSSALTLIWELPAGQISPQHFEIWRNASGGPNDFEFMANVTLEKFTDYKVTPGAYYTYAVVAYYSAKLRPTAYKDAEIPLADNSVAFTSTPVTTAKVNELYRYFFEISPSDQDIDFYMVGNSPIDMTINHIYNNQLQKWVHFVSWVPASTGVYEVSISARNRNTEEEVIQEYCLNVGDHCGRLKGRVLDAQLKPIADCFLRFIHLSSNGSSMNYECRTTSDGMFTLDNVQEGRIYAYAQAPGDDYAPQWYSNATTLAAAYMRYLRENDSLSYEFTLLPNQKSLTRIFGTAVSTLGEVIPEARISFVRKSRFIYIGDTANVDNPAFQSLITRNSNLVDTSVITNASGQYELRLASGTDYYAFAEKDGFRRAFSSDQTNPLEARAFMLPSTSTSIELNFTLDPLGASTNSICGTVRVKKSGQSAKAIIILIDAELKRGAGGGSTFRRYTSGYSDTNGVFVIENLPASTNYCILAVPVDRDLLPQYFGYAGSTEKFIESEEINIIGSIQNCNFVLNSTSRSGIGTVYGRVMVNISNQLVPAPGTIVMVQNLDTGKPVGYAISDSTGWYSITGLPSGSYEAYADNPAFGSAFHPGIPLNYLNYDDPLRVQVVNFTINLLMSSTSDPVMPNSLTLGQNTPNPFNPATTIEVYLPARANAVLTVFDALGRQVATLADGVLDAGTHRFTFDASNLAGGSYFYTLKSNGTTLVRKMTLLK